MRKVILFMMTSVNGYFEAPNHNIDWHTVDEEFNDFAVAQTNSAGVLLFGRVTYELMASYWPTQQAMNDDPQITEVMNRLPKVVFSRSLDKADWQNTRLVKTDAAAEVARLKQEPGNDLFVFGSSALTASLAAAGVMDEYRIMISPTLLAQGTPLLQGLPADIKLKLVNTRTFGNGNLLLTYQPA